LDVEEYDGANHNYKVWVIQCILAVNPKRPTWSVFNASYIKVAHPVDGRTVYWLRHHPEFKDHPMRCRFDGTVEGKRFSDSLAFRDEEVAHQCLAMLRKDGALTTSDQFRLVCLNVSQQMTVVVP
jgi:hypothetical protein